MLYEDSMDQQRLITFLGHMLRASKQKIFLILDNLKVYHGKMVAQWVSKHQDKIELFFLPPYAPESNPDKYLNHALKLSVHSGNLPKNHRIFHNGGKLLFPNYFIPISFLLCI